MNVDNNSQSSEDSDEYEYDSSSDNGYEYPADDDMIQQSHEKEGTSLFNQEPTSCPICCDEKVEEGCAISLPACSHSFCVVCFTKYVDVQIGQGSADDIRCPFILPSDDGGSGTAASAADSNNKQKSSGGNSGSKSFRQCNASVELDVLHEVMTQESYDKLSQMRDAAFVRKNVDYHHCPTPDCSNIVLCRTVFSSSNGDASRTGSNYAAANDDGGITGGARICDCFKCGKTTCLTCGASPFHTNKTCVQHREDEQWRKRLLVHSYNWRRYTPVDRSRANEETVYDFNMNIAQQSTSTTIDAGSNSNSGSEGHQVNDNLPPNIKRCRRCGNGVELQSGCLKLKCLCGYRFCFQCGSENAQCDCTPAHHGFTDNTTGRGDFSGLRETKSYT